MRNWAAQVILLDRTLAEYGPEARAARGLLKDTVAARVSQLWPGEGTGNTPTALGRGLGVEAVQRNLLDLAPQTDAQRWLKSEALRISQSMAEARWTAIQQFGTSIHWPFMVVLVFWLAVIFASFGLFAPRNWIVVSALIVAALSVRARSSSSWRWTGPIAD